MAFMWDNRPDKLFETRSRQTARWSIQRVVAFSRPALLTGHRPAWSVGDHRIFPDCVRFARDEAQSVRVKGIDWLNRGGIRELAADSLEMERAARDRPWRLVRPSLRRCPADTVGVAMPKTS